MKKSYLIIISMLVLSGIAFSQTATDFTVNDCKGISHNLFSELDSGKVIVMVWAMPCGACSGPAKTAFNIAKTYETLNPGRVLFYLADDYANTSCTSISSWGKSSIDSNITATFSNAAIKMSNYGTAGMPKTVVLGRSSHKVFFNQNNAVNSTNLKSAIDQALVPEPIDNTGIEENRIGGITFNIYPNPVDNKTNISYFLEKEMDVKIELFNMLGERVQSIVSEKQNAGEYQVEINTNNLINGTYFVDVNGKTLKFQVSH